MNKISTFELFGFRYFSNALFSNSFHFSIGTLTIYTFLLKWNVTLPPDNLLCNWKTDTQTLNLCSGLFFVHVCVCCRTELLVDAAHSHTCKLVSWNVPSVEDYQSFKYLLKLLSFAFLRYREFYWTESTLKFHSEAEHFSMEISLLKFTTYYEIYFHILFDTNLITIFNRFQFPLRWTFSPEKKILIVKHWICMLFFSWWTDILSIENVADFCGESFVQPLFHTEQIFRYFWAQHSFFITFNQFVRFCSPFQCTTVFGQMPSTRSKFIIEC